VRIRIDDKNKVNSYDKIKHLVEVDDDILAESENQVIYILSHDEAELLYGLSNNGFASGYIT
jgi:hypothetical protein